MRIEQISVEPCQLGECPLWCERTARLWWVDVLQGHLWSVEPGGDVPRRHRVRARRLGSIALYEDGALLLACDDGLYRFDPETGEQQFLLDPKPDRPAHRLNDGRTDPYGSFWVGCLQEDDYRPGGRLYRIAPDGTCHVEAQGLSIPNALAFDPGRGRMYFGDTRAYTIWACDQLPGGGLANRRVFATLPPPARPDGSCLDRDGNLWNAIYAGGRLHQYSPAGELLQQITLPVSHPTCLAFGGPDLGTLFVTSAARPLSAEERHREPLAGQVLALRPGAVGRPEYRLHPASTL